MIKINNDNLIIKHNNRYSNNNNNIDYLTNKLYENPYSSLKNSRNSFNLQPIVRSNKSNSHNRCLTYSVSTSSKNFFNWKVIVKSRNTWGDESSKVK